MWGGGPDGIGRKWVGVSIPQPKVAKFVSWIACIICTIMIVVIQCDVMGECHARNTTRRQDVFITDSVWIRKTKNGFQGYRRNECIVL